MAELKRLLANHDPQQDSPAEKGAFFSEGTEDEHEAFDREENKGWKDFMRKVFNL